MLSDKNFRGVLTDAQIEEMIARDEVRRQAAIDRLGSRWLLAATRLPKPENVTNLKAKKGSK